MRRSALVFAVFSLTLCAATGAQQQTFKSGVSLVTVDVTVLDKYGKPVPGLAAEDFEIKLNGKLQPVRALAFVQASTAGAAPVSAKASAAKPADVAAATPKPAAAIVANEVETRRTVSNQDGAPVAAPSAPAAAPEQPAPALPAPPAHQNEPRTFVILIDDLSFTPLNGKKLFLAAQKFVDTVPTSDPVGFTTTSGSATVNPTMDRAAVQLALGKVVGEFIDPRQIRAGDTERGQKEQPIGMNESIDIDRGDDTLLKEVIIRECFHGVRTGLDSKTVQEIILQSVPGFTCPSDIASEAKRTAALVRQTKGRQLAAITSVVNAMRAASGIRHLVVVTDGIAIQRDVIDLQPLTRAAAAAGIQFSVIMEDPEIISMQTNGRTFSDTVAPPPSGDSGGATRIREDNRLMLNGAQTFTDMVGGTFYKVVGEANTSFARILEASSAVYRLGVELPTGTQPGKELSLAVNLKRPGLTVRANRMAVNLPEPAPAHPAPAAPAAPASPGAPKLITGPVLASIDDVLKSALNQNEALRGVPIRLGASMRRSTATPGQIDVTVTAILPASAKTPITTLVGVVDDTNGLRVSRRVVDNAVDAVQFLLPLAPGNYAIRFAAADADKALGLVELPLAVKLHTLGTFTASDVMTWVANDASKKATLFSTDEVPATGTLHASIELYPPGAMPAEAPAVKWTVTRDGETKAVFEDELDAQAGPSQFRSDVEIPFATFAPGTYVIRATLLAADKPAGSVGAVVRKK